MIRFTSLEKRFGRLEVLRGINLDLDFQGITAVLGPNGSGKTTLLKSLLGMVIPSAGDIFFRNASVKNQHTYRSDIAHVPQVSHFPENLTSNQLLQMIKDIRPGQTRDQYLIDLFELRPELHKKMRNLSGGNRQKINLILGLMYDKPVIILDEPSNGLDPLSVLNLKSFLKAEERKGKLILFTTHLISFVEDVASNIIFLLDGHIYFQGPVKNLLRQEEERNLETAIAKILRKSVSVP